MTAALPTIHRPASGNMTVGGVNGFTAVTLHPTTLNVSFAVLFSKYLYNISVILHEICTGEPVRKDLASFLEFTLAKARKEHRYLTV